ncbi:MAG: sigma-70 family RNA polymerase sigma factor, partial [Verrucomicrobiota bacterium]
CQLVFGLCLRAISPVASRGAARSANFICSCGHSVSTPIRRKEKILWRIPGFRCDILMNMSDTDLQLLARYVRHHAEDAFAEIVRRHLDLVHSAALRQVRSPELAEEVAQAAFLDLARQAHLLPPDTVVPAWLYQVTRRTAIDVVRRETSRQLREQVAQELHSMNATAADWTYIEPLLDEAMHALDDTDRAAVLFRYFENKSLREVGQILGTSENAAQKRLSRAVERLREFFAKRGVTIGASGLAVVISANAVQAAPVGLAVTITTAAALVGTTLATAATATITALNLAIMSKLKISALSALVVAAVATPLVIQQQSLNRLSEANSALQEQARLVNVLRGEHEELLRQLSGARQSQSLSKAQLSELLRLRGEVGPLRRDSQELARFRVKQLAEQAAATPAQPASAHDFIPAAAWANVGADKPEAAIQTFFWAGQHGETNLIGNLLRWQRDRDIPASDELDQTFVNGLVGGSTQFASSLQGFRVTSQEEQDNEVRMGLELTNKDGKPESHTVRLVHEDNQWFPVMHVWLHDQGSVRAAMDVPPKFQQSK